MTDVIRNQRENDILKLPFVIFFLFVTIKITHWYVWEDAKQQ